MWLARDARAELVELFAGGSYASLLAVIEGYVDRATLVEVDPAICALWRTVFSDDAKKLCAQIRAFDFTAEKVADVLQKSVRSDVSVAFQTIIKNRARRGGILADGAGILRAGERKKGLASRWYPETLTDRIGRLNGYADRFRVVEGDVFDALRTLNRRRNSAKLFVDPPYTRLSEPGVKPLYRFNHVDHPKLFGLLSKTPHDFLITYDDSTLVRDQANRHGFEIKRIPMRTAHSVEKFELLLSRRGV
ncbi:DNA adenine methylase [Burkholderia gladioli]|uniref:DNA adenine methylase n=1 Tax=Burkholderia gladioli TaxID=28095 RepID=UPI0011B24F1B|nr:DNA adenine methylase [Burkholderia gladioli]